MPADLRPDADAGPDADADASDRAEPPADGSGDRADADGGGGCGDGILGPGEECDDGNRVAGDGCEPDCTWTCESNPECPPLPCTLSGRCDPVRHECIRGPLADDGTPCEADGDPGTRDVCGGGTCARSRCGDAVVDPGRTPAEECDDGNGFAGDGCEPDCRWTCTGPAACDDGDPCNGAETCGPAHACARGAAPADGTPCERDADPATRDVCRGGRCAASRCGDGLVDRGADPPEQCEDGNEVEGDGCEPRTCRWSCAGDAACDDGEPCDGAEACRDHRCVAGAPPADGSACATAAIAAGVCREGACRRPWCGNGWLEPGETCDDGNLVDGDGCDTDCAPSCAGDGDCDDGESCTRDRCAAAAHGRLCVREALPDGTACTPGSRCTEPPAECRTGACIGVPIACADGDPCTEDGCDPAIGCTHRSLGTPWFVDLDGDGWGGDRVCAPAQPAGTVARGEDCCDRRADVHPEASPYHEAAYGCGASPVSYDYDCDRAETRALTAAGGCVRREGRCEHTAGWARATPECGSRELWITGCDAGCGLETELRRQACR